MMDPSTLMIATSSTHASCRRGSRSVPRSTSLRVRRGSVARTGCDAVHTVIDSRLGPSRTARAAARRRWGRPRRSRGSPASQPCRRIRCDVRPARRRRPLVPPGGRDLDDVDHFTVDDVRTVMGGCVSVDVVHTSHTGLDSAEVRGLAFLVTGSTACPSWDHGPMARTRRDATPPGDLAEAARILRVVLDALPPLDRLGRSLSGYPFEVVGVTTATLPCPRRAGRYGVATINNARREASRMGSVLVQTGG